MKIRFLILLFCFLLNAGKAQIFVLGATDLSGDQTQSLSPDLKTVYHAFDPAADSIWFKLEFYVAVDDEAWNIKIGLDTNNNPADGGTWTGLNQSMKYDLLADVYSNPSFGAPFGNLLDGSGNYISSNISIAITDTATVIVGMRLSEIAEAGGMINYIVGTGIVVGLVNDEAPETNYISINLLSAGTENYSYENEISFYPNPADNQIFLSGVDKTGSPIRIEIFNAQGNLCISKELNTPRDLIDIEPLAPGIYFLNISGGIKISRTKFIKE